LKILKHFIKREAKRIQKTASKLETLTLIAKGMDTLQVKNKNMEDHHPLLSLPRILMPNQEILDANDITAAVHISVSKLNRLSFFCTECG
jgi:hypothetical protein